MNTNRWIQLSRCNQLTGNTTPKSTQNCNVCNLVRNVISYWLFVRKGLSRSTTGYLITTLKRKKKINFSETCQKNQHETYSSTSERLNILSNNPYSRVRLGVMMGYTGFWDHQENFCWPGKLIGLECGWVSGSLASCLFT